MDDTGAPSPALPRPRNPRGPALSPGRITTEAMRMIDEGGLDAFSFRALATRLECQAMSIYHYYPSKAHLYEALVELCIAEVRDFSDAGSWQSRLRAAVKTYRKTGLNHPGFFLFFSTFRLNNHSGLAFLQRILKIFEATGLSAEARARHFRILGYYLGGALIDETIGYANGTNSLVPVPDDVAKRDFPAIMAVGPWFGRDQHEATFNKGIEILIAGIEADLAATAGSGQTAAPGTT